MPAFSNTVSVIAIILSIAAILVSLWTYNRVVNPNLPIDDISLNDLYSPEPLDDGADIFASPLVNSPASPAPLPSSGPLSEQIQDQFGIARTYVDLTLLRSQLAASDNYDEAVASIQQIRSDLERAFAQTSEATQQRWQQIDENLNQAETFARQQSAQSLDYLDDAITQLRQEVSPQ